ncbi:MAG TPA: GTPase Era, partial [Pseudomonadales bacterium]|nr:GTPase Era [Pseudomonadales bacterium]
MKKNDGMSTTDHKSRCGMVAIVGRPNVGKSTLLNHMVGQKLCITSRKPQTTRHLILGVKTVPGAQMIFVDTPGIHQGGRHVMNRRMNRAAASVLHDVDVVMWVVDRSIWTEEDRHVLDRLQETALPVILVINKIDEIKDKEKLLPLIEDYAQKRPFAAIVPLSALQGTGLDMLDEVLLKLLPAGDFVYPEDQITDKSERFFAAEIIREKIIRQLGEELPYQTAVEIEQFADEGNLLRISGLILVEKEGQK